MRFDRELAKAARDVVEGWYALAGTRGHHMGCECGGVGEGDTDRALSGDLTNLHTCGRLVKDMATLRGVLDNV